MIARRPRPRPRSSSRLLRPAQQILAARFQGRAQHLGIGGDEVAGRHGVDELAGIEVDLLPGLLVRALELVDRLDQPARSQKIGLLDEVEERVVAPGRVAKAAIAVLGLDHRGHGAAEQLLAGRLPELQVALPQRQLGVRDGGRIGHDPGGQLEHGRSEVEGIGRAGAVGAAAPREIAQQLLALLVDLAHQLDDILAPAVRRFLLPGHLVPLCFGAVASASERKGSLANAI